MKVLAASLAMAAVILGVGQALPPLAADSTTLGTLGYVVVAGGAGIAAYLAVVLVLRVEEAWRVWSLAWARLSVRVQGPGVRDQRSGRKISHPLNDRPSPACRTPSPLNHGHGRLLRAEERNRRPACARPILLEATRTRSSGQADRREAGQGAKEAAALVGEVVGKLPWPEGLRWKFLEKLLGKILGKELGERVARRLFPGAEPRVVIPIDPNEKVGPAGAGGTRGIYLSDELRYTIYFENLSTATAPAQEVVIVDNLGPNLDWSSFRPREVAFGSRTLAASGDTAAFSAQVDVADYRGDVYKSWPVDIAATMNSETGRVTWTLRTLDLQTGQLPSDALAGFLPPNDATGRGEGHVIFSVRPRPNVPLGTVLRNQASITFDTETTINTNVVTNTVGVRTYLPLVVKGTPMP